MHILTSERLRRAFDTSNPNQPTDKKELMDDIFINNEGLKEYLSFLANSNVRKYGMFLNCDTNDLIQGLAKKLLMQKTLKGEWKSIKSFLAVTLKRYIIDLLRPNADIIHGDKIIEIKICQTKKGIKRMIARFREGKNIRKRGIPPYAIIEYKRDCNGNQVIDSDVKKMIDIIIIPKRPCSNIQVDKNDVKDMDVDANFDILEDSDLGKCEEENAETFDTSNEEKGIEGFDGSEESSDYRGDEHESEFKTSLRKAMDKVSMISPMHTRDIIIIKLQIELEEDFKGGISGEIASRMNLLGWCISEDNVRKRMLRMCEPGGAKYKLQKMLSAFDPKTF